ncbi:MAG TPA: c-type cytochrome, partial [Kofleriaceae bacterium]|nr:c-type cytochrome [Kofleriaceae bacterium]
LSHELAFFGFSSGAGAGAAAGAPAQTTAQIGLHQPRAIAWDQGHDALYVAGLGSDQITEIDHASQASIASGRTLQLGDERTPRCGPDGLAVGADGKLFVWCAFSRTVKQIEHASELKRATEVKDGPELVASAFTAKQHDGLVLFHTASSQVSASGALACASCHPDQRADGLSWRIEKRELQTPLLAGRLVGTHPFKWDGGDPTLRDSLSSTMKRLGGTGLSRKQTDALAAYLEALPAPRAPTRDPAQVARGKQLFDAEGCRSCHAGAAYTDRARHQLTGTLKASDTPSLIGVAASAPYFHDGSAATLEALLRDRGAVHGMADTGKLSDPQVSDLTAFLETL